MDVWTRINVTFCHELSCHHTWLVKGALFNTVKFNSSVYDETTSMAGKTVAITGGNTGLGKETAVKLAALGADVIILCRNPANAQAAVTEIKERSGWVRCVAIKDICKKSRRNKCSSLLTSASSASRKKTILRLITSCNNPTMWSILSCYHRIMRFVIPFALSYLVMYRIMLVFILLCSDLLFAEISSKLDIYWRDNAECC